MRIMYVVFQAFSLSVLRCIYSINFLSQVSSDILCIINKTDNTLINKTENSLKFVTYYE